MTFKHILDGVSVRYVVLREREEYTEGSDIDIYCDNRWEMANQIVYLSRRYLEAGNIVRLTQDGTHSHVDFFKEDKLVRRFDLIDSLDDYREAVYAGSEEAKVATRLLEYAKNPHKTQHLDYARSHLLQPQ